ncbi:hypothetical protein L9F63_009090, partial [Diploptera punctata]
MADEGRRRKPRDSEDSEKFSEDSYGDNEIIKGSEEEGDPNASTEGTRESEYETVGDSETDDSTAVDEDDDDSVIIEYEREEGDGQESVPPKEKKLDDDEDRRNPQYIPKRGTFYEHDDRTATEDASGGETNDKEAVDRATKESQGGGDAKAKKVWREHENRWSHDRYNPDEQAPKSREELIAIYGYDIRNEEGPPRARRRRRYGRGPNKYTRNWEDEDAYGKPQATTQSTRGNRRGGRRGGANQTRGIDVNQEEFPPLINNKQNNENSDTSAEQNLPIQGSTYSNRTIGGRKYKEERNNIKKTQQDAFPPLDLDSHPKNIVNELVNRTQNLTINNNVNSREENSGTSNVASNRRVHRDIRDVPFTDGGPRNVRWRGRGRGRGSCVGGMDGNLTKSRGNIRSSSGTRLSQDSVQHLHQDEGNVHTQHHQSQQQQLQSQQSQSGVTGSDRRQQVVVPPRMQHQQQQQQDNSGSNRPKRYSSLRQRSLPESGTTYTQAPPNAYFQAAGDLEAGDNGNNRPKRYSTIRPCSGAVYPQPDPAPTYFPPAGYVTPQPVYGDTPQHPQSAGTPPLQLITPHAHAAGPAYAATFPSPPTGFVGPAPRMLPPVAGAPPPFIPAPAPGAPILNYVATPSAYTAFQSYTAVFSSQRSGITYYNTEEQNIVPRPITQKRQRSAIPIVPPPERAPRGRGRTNREETSPPVAANTNTLNPPSSSPPPPTSWILIHYLASYCTEIKYLNFKCLFVTTLAILSHTLKNAPPLQVVPTFHSDDSVFNRGYKTLRSITTKASLTPQMVHQVNLNLDRRIEIFTDHSPIYHKDASCRCENAPQYRRP